MNTVTSWYILVYKRSAWGSGMHFFLRYEALLCLCNQWWNEDLQLSLQIFQYEREMPESHLSFVLNRCGAETERWPPCPVPNSSLDPSVEWSGAGWPSPGLRAGSPGTVASARLLAEPGPCSLR